MSPTRVARRGSRGSSVCPTYALPTLAAELVALKVDVIVAASTLAALAAKQATRTLPIVFAVAPDPVTSGLVTSLARPGGNVTGSSILARS
jgi:putative ABC transport system substrate-binding protein